ncbi:MAG: hypothetical protein ACKOWF_03005, partial [Chloroflexota bacterium]
RLVADPRQTAPAGDLAAGSDTPGPGVRYESIDHERPTVAGVLAAVDEDAPGTGIFGDEVLVRDIDPEGAPGLYPGAAARTGGIAHPGPTPAVVEDDIERRG